MPKFNVLKRLLHDGKLFHKDQSVDLTPAQAKPLIELGHVAAPEGKKADKE